jgi:hypothetical protein
MRSDDQYFVTQVLAFKNFFGQCADSSVASDPLPHPGRQAPDIDKSTDPATTNIASKERVSDHLLSQIRFHILGAHEISDQRAGLSCAQPQPFQFTAPTIWQTQLLFVLLDHLVGNRIILTIVLSDPLPHPGCPRAMRPEGDSRQLRRLQPAAEHRADGQGADLPL